MPLSNTLVLLSAAAALLQGGPLMAQATPPVDTSAKSGSNVSIFAPLTLAPAPSAIRTAHGTPGPKYWQNRVDYDLHGTLDTAMQVVRGTLTLHYTNHSPDTLPVCWFAVGGLLVDSVAQIVNGKAVPLTLRDTNEVTPVTLARPIAPGQSATITMAWRKKISRRSYPLYEAYDWYPKIRPYDDVQGWDTSTNDGAYGEYGDVTLAITVPAGYIVAATGTLVNPQEVLTAAEVTRLAQAAKSPTPVAIITGDELQTGAARPTHTGMLTWRFRAKRVYSPSWNASPNYQWDAASWHGILLQSYYRPSATAALGHGVGVTGARLSLQEYSERWAPYPYPQISVVEGLQPGTAYPMLALVNSLSTPKGTYSVITHEIGHTWFPILVGSNERLHGWMSEGFDTFINAFSRARARQPSTARLDSSLVFYGNKIEGGKLEGATEADVEYNMAALVLQLLRSNVLGPAVFDKAFRSYIQRWTFKHPTPVDFFRTMEDVSGRHLDWFWREWVLEDTRFDQGIDAVRQTVQGAETHVTVTYGNKGRAVLPLLVRFTFSDATTQNVTYSAEVWRANPATYTVSYTFPNKTVRSIVLDPDTHLPDADRSNNTWTAK